MEIKEQIHQEKFRMIEEWKNSGLSQKEFCKRINIGYPVFQYWLKKYKSPNSLPEDSSGFISLQVAENSSVLSAEIFLPNGTKILLKSIDSTFIRSLIY
jgi:hypothetical protein